MIETNTRPATYTLAGKEYPVTGYVRSPEFGTVPVVGIRMMSDYTWMQGCLESRLENPEVYARFENVDEKIALLRAWLAEHSPDQEDTTR